MIRVRYSRADHSALVATLPFSGDCWRFRVRYSRARSSALVATPHPLSEGTRGSSGG